MLIDIISWAIFGLIAGTVAKLLMPGNDPGGCIVTILIGVAGALLGGWLGGQLGIYEAQAEAWSWEGFFTAVVGALLLLFVHRLFAGRGRAA